MQKQRSYVGRALSLEMQKSAIRQPDLARLCEISQPSVWSIICKDVRLQVSTLKAITHCWPSPDANGRVLIAHLRDEIRRSGHDPETALDIRWPDGRAATTRVERDMEVLRSHMSDHDVSALIHELATLLRRADKALRESARADPVEDLAAAAIAAEAAGESYGGKKHG